MSCFMFMFAKMKTDNDNTASTLHNIYTSDKYFKNEYLDCYYVAYLLSGTPHTCANQIFHGF